MIIGIDSSSAKGTLAIDDGRCFKLDYVEDIPFILRKKNIYSYDIEKILITLGPGSFTSLRVGLIIAKGIAIPNGIPILGYSTFRTIAEGAPSGEIIPLLYARTEVVFAAHYRKSKGEIECIFKDRIMKIKNLISYLKDINGKPVILGYGAFKNEEILKNEGFIISKSSDIAPLLFNLYEKNISYTLNPDHPLYLSKSEAFRKREVSDIILKHMQIEDIDDAMKIERDVFPEPWDSDIFYLLIIKEECLTISGILDGKLIAYMIGCPEGEKFHLMNIAVSRKYWRKGFGTKMLSYLLKKLKKSKEIKNCYLEYRINNKAALEIYKKFGFKFSGIKKGYYTNGDDAVVMEIPV